MNKWIGNNKGKIPIKEDLAQWVSHALKRALTKENITKGFEVTGIYPLNPHTMKFKMEPSIVYETTDVGTGDSQPSSHEFH